jgi:hypothetical protein
MRHVGTCRTTPHRRDRYQQLLELLYRGMVTRFLQARCDEASSPRSNRGAVVSVQESAKRTVIPTLVRWVILGIVIVIFRFFRWGGVIGLVGIGTFAAAIWLAFHRADPDTGELTGVEGTVVLALLIAGVVVYVVGVIHRRRRKRTQPMPASD